MGLETYRQKRNFERTAEPRGRQARRTGHGFIVQKHDARALHYDFRLELGGVLLSWAVPKGPSLDPKVKRLAMQTEDHPLEYADFEGVIPEGEYGGGTVLLWDRGTWEPEGDAEQMYQRGRLNFTLHGQKLHGSFHLVRTGARGSSRSADARRWLLFKSNDAAAQPGSDAALLEAQPRSVASGRDLEAIARDPDHVWTSQRADAASSGPTAPRAAPRARSLPAAADQPGARRAKLPRFIAPELATLVAEAPEGDDWLHEIKLDGYRILARIEGGRARLLSRRGLDWTAKLPSLASALGALPVESAWLDGEVVVLKPDGASDFQQLQNSMQAGRDVDALYYAFDLAFLDGLDLRALPLLERKALLRPRIEQLASERVRFGDHVQGGGAAFFARAGELGLEGIVSKRADSPYASKRSKSWLKVKCRQEQEVIIGGYTAPGGSRRHLGALLVGQREQGVLKYAGKVGTGFSEASLAELAARLEPLRQDEPAFDDPPRGAEARGVRWVKPLLVAQVAFVERTRDGRIRHASFQGLRDDKPARDVHPERAERAAPAQKAARKPAKKRPVTKKRATKKSAPASASPKPRRPAQKTASKASKPRPAKKRPAAAASSIELDFSRFEVTHPERVLFPDPGITKRELMLYYARVAQRMLPHVLDRPLMLVRCPEGADAHCFHQKHASAGMPRSVSTLTIEQKSGPEENLIIRDADGLFGLVQMGALEIDGWGCTSQRLEAPDQLVFDIDPDVGLGWERVVQAAHDLREELAGHGLTGFLRVTGGKGLHVVVPLTPSLPWDEAKQFSKSIADALVQRAPDRYLSTMSKQKRKGKIFLDYFRNGAGATAVLSYSTRARAGAPLAVPVGWDELDAGLRPDGIALRDVEARLSSDPWQDFDAARVPIR